MKKYAFVLIGLLGVSLVACDDQNVSPNSLENAFIDSATSGGGGAPHDGQRPPKLTEVDISTLSSTITSYISANFAGFTIEKAGKDSLNNFIVGIKSETDKKGLKFDANGVFVEELRRPEKQGQDGKMGERPQLTEVAITDLPATVIAYISKNYSGGTIEKSGKDTDGNFHVLVKNSEKIVGLLFNADGTFSKELPPPPKGKKG